MKLIRYDHYNPINQLDRFFEDALSNWERSGLLGGLLRDPGVPSLAINLHEDAHNFYVTAEVPGMKRESLKVELENAVLTLSGEHAADEEKGSARFQFSRSITVGDQIEPSKVKANLKDGILTVTLPRSDARKPRTIQVA
jgi:HSP20 family protein